MNDLIIRNAFHESILKSAHEDTNTVVVDELGIKNGVVRADIAVLNGKLIGYEIKSERDSLVRLPPQVIAYDEVFEASYIITADKHLHKITEHIPEWWGIYTIKLNKITGAIDFNCERPSKQNLKRNVYAIAQLLWKSEAAEILSLKFECKIKSNYTRNHLYNMLSEICDVDQMSEIVLKCLKQRAGWRTNQRQLL